MKNITIILLLFASLNGISQGNSTSDWHELGPYSNNKNGILNSPFERNDETRKMGIGPIEFISINKNNPDQLLAGSQYGGLFYSTDAAANWTNMGSDAWNTSGCSNAIFHPSTENIFYATSSRGPGKAGTGQRNEIHGQAKVKRLFRGKWEDIGDFKNFGGTAGKEAAANKYYKLLAEPVPWYQIRLYVATEHGLYYTDNANDPVSSISWTKDPHPLLNGKIYDIELIPNQSGRSADKIIASVYSAVTNKWSIVYTENRGLTWKILPNAPVFNANHPKVGYLTIEVSDANSDAIYVYAGNKPDRYLYRYSLSGQNSTFLKKITDNIGKNFGHGHAFGVSNSNSNFLAVNQALGIDLTFSSNSSNNWQGEIYTGHDDVEDIVWHPNTASIVYVANHGGVYKSTNHGQSFYMASEGLGVAEIWNFASSATDPSRIVIGLNHNGNQVSLNSYSEPFKPKWHYRGPYADSFDPMIDYTDPNKVWLKGQAGQFEFFDDIENPNAKKLGDVPAKLDWYVESVLNSSDPSIVYYNFNFKGNHDIRRSKGYGYGFLYDEGENDDSGSNDHEQISHFGNLKYKLSNYSILKLFTDPNNADVLYAFVLDFTKDDDDNITEERYKLYRNSRINWRDKGFVINSWEELKIPKNSEVADIEVSHEDGNVLYFAYSNNWEGGKKFYRVDYSNTTECILGNNCIDHTGNLPYGGAGGGIALEKGTNEGAYIVTNKGVWFSNQSNLANGIRQWTEIGTNLPHAPTTGAEINYKINKIRISYKGRGIWEHDLQCPTTQNTTETGLHGQDKFVEVYNNISSTAIVPSSRDVDYRAGNEIKLNPGFKALPGSDFKAFIHPCDMAGNSFRLAKDLPYGEFEDEEKSSETATKLDVRIYPNPNKGQFNIELNSGEENALVEVYDVVGKQVFSQNNVNNILRIDLKDETKGLYFVRVTIGNQVFNEKVVYN